MKDPAKHKRVLKWMKGYIKFWNITLKFLTICLLSILTIAAATLFMYSIYKVFWIPGVIIITLIILYIICYEYVNDTDTSDCINATNNERSTPMFYYKALMHTNQPTPNEKPTPCYIGSCHPFLTDGMLRNDSTITRQFYQQVQTKHPNCTYISDIQLTELSDIIRETNLETPQNLESADNFFIL